VRDDLKYAFRRLWQQPGFTITAVLTLALGLGANTAIFTLLQAVIYRPLPVSRPAELYRLGGDTNCCINSGLQKNYSLFSTELYVHLRDSLPEFSDLAAVQANTTVTGLRPADAAVPLSTPAAYVSSNYFRMLGVRAHLGRLLEPSDDQPGAPVVMAMSYAAWRDTFNADASLVGKTFFVGGTPVTLAGVAAPDFFGETVRANPAGIWLPLGQEPILRRAASLNARPSSDWLYAIGRLKTGSTRDGVEPKATAALVGWLAAQDFWSATERQTLKDSRIAVTSAAGGVQLMRGNFGQSLTLLLSMSALVLLIAAANLANLLLARADRVSASIRAALGASSGRLVRQALVEGLVLAFIGCAGALLVSTFASRAIVALAFPADVHLPVDPSPSLAAVAFSFALAIVTGLLFAAAPAWAMGRTDPIQSLRGVSREGADVAFMPRRSLVVVQVTLSLILLAGAGLLGKSLTRLEGQPLGFDPVNREIVRLDPPAIAGEPDRLAAMYTTMKERVDAIPGVVSSSYALYSPMEGNNWSGGIAINGRPDPERKNSSSWNRVGPDYFETMGTRIVRGRAISRADTPASAHVAVVNQAFVTKFFADADPIGQRLGVGAAENSADYEIVGVSEDVKYAGPAQPVRPMIFLPVMQLAHHASPELQQTQARSTLVRTLELHLQPGAANVEPAVRKALAEANQDLTAMRFLPISEQIAGNFRTGRLLATLTSAYGVLALALASLGLYGVTAYGVSRRTHEIGVRMALGADQQRIVWDVLRGAVLQASIGLVIGVPLAMMAASTLTSQLYGVDTKDPWVFGVAVLALVLTAAIAAALPARRAAAVNPTKALRS
jgi:macrolide transport system ATP-binding/permease protein